MDLQHCNLAPFHMSQAPRSTEGLAVEGKTGQLQRNAAIVSPSLRGGAAQNSWACGSVKSAGLKRKRRNGEDFSVRGSQEAFTLSPKSSTECGISAGSQSSSGVVCLRGVEDECFAAGLRLGLTAHSSEAMAEDACFTSLISGGRSDLTSTHSGGHLYENSREGKRMQPDFVFCAKNGGVLGMGTSDLPAHASGMQVQLCLSDSSSLTADSDFISPLLPRGVGQRATYQEAMKEALSSCESIPVVDEGSTSSRIIKAGGYMPSLLMGRSLERLPSFGTDRQNGQQEGNDNSTFGEHVDGIGELGAGFLSNETISESNIFTDLRSSSAATSTSPPAAGWGRAPKICKFRGCNKGARGASCLCIIHGGGRRCQRQGCKKTAEGSTVYCKSHGGGRRCQHLGCPKSAEGKTDYCIAHGGGRRCSHDECMKAARGRSGLCIRHGGGKRCQKEGCTKSAEGYSGLCISHGGGRRCQYEGCKKGAQGSTMFCKAHGGGKRCMIQGCNKGAEGSTPLCKGHGGGKRCLFEGGGICTKSVHGGTSFCVAHGGGKRCAIKDCTKSARGRTDFCVRHGGGKRCKVENCTKSAQGSTDFCKAHGGGKRCCWGQEGSPYSEFIKDKMCALFKGPCERFARGKLGLCAAHAALVQDRRVHGVGMIGDTLSSGIGPGLFRGIVENSVSAGHRTECGHDANKLSIHIGSGLGDAGSKRALPKLSSLSGQSYEDRMEVGGDYGVPELPTGSIGYVSGLTFDGSSLKFLDEPSPPTDKDVRGAMTISNLGFGLWPDASMPSAGNSGMMADVALDASVASTRTTPNDSMLIEMREMDIPFQCSLLPSQVLVPLSMRKGDMFSQNCDDLFLTFSSTDRHDGISQMPSVCLPPQRGAVEDRVHGGNAMSLLAGRTLSLGRQADD